MTKSDNTETSVKIAISGTHSTGKSTFVDRLAGKLTALGRDYSVIREIVRECRLPILKEQTTASTLWMVATGIVEEVEAEQSGSVVLVDRPILDPLAYLLATEVAIREDSADYEALEGMIAGWVRTYDLIIHSRLDRSIPFNKAGRDPDPHYRETIANNLLHLYIKFDIAPIVMIPERRHEIVEEVISVVSRKLDAS